MQEKPTEICGAVILLLLTMNKTQDYTQFFQPTLRLHTKPSDLLNLLHPPTSQNLRLQTKSTEMRILVTVSMIVFSSLKPLIPVLSLAHHVEVSSLNMK